MPVPVYTFYLHKDKDAVPSFEILDFNDEALAVAYGKKLLKDRTRYKFVEITRDDQGVAKVTRDDL